MVLKKKNGQELKISLITVALNNKDTIEQTIQSVLTQDYQNKEYIIIDGGSTDGTVAIIKKYAEKIAYWESEKDRGIAHAFNKGIKKATGEIVGIINADDFYKSNILAKVNQMFKEYEALDFLFGDLMFVDQKGAELFLQKGNADFARSISYEMPSIPHPTVFVRKNAYEKYGLFAEKYKVAMDYELLLRFFKKGAFALYMPEILACMRLGGTSDNAFWQANREVRDISVCYGYNPYAAHLYCCLKSFKSFCKRILDRFGLGLLTKLWRFVFSKRYFYKS